MAQNAYALLDLNDINTVTDALNKYKQDGIQIEKFYDQVLLDRIRIANDQFIHLAKAETRPMPKGHNKLVLKRYGTLTPHTVPLAEGIPPKSDKIDMGSLEMTHFAYGRYMEFTDRVDLDLIDPIVALYTKEYSDLAAQTLDLLARDAMLAEGQPFFANARATFEDLKIGDVPSLDELRIVITTLERLMVKPYTNSFYTVIISPEIRNDLVLDPRFEKFMDIGNDNSPYVQNTVSKIFRMEFVETLHDEVHYGNKIGEFMKDGEKCLRVYKETSTGVYEYRTLTAAAALKAASTNYLADGSYIPENKEWQIPEGFRPLPVHRAIVLGQGGLVKTGFSGEMDAKMFVKPLGSTGVLDPIDQRQSIGFKINSIGFKAVRNEAIQVYHCIPSTAV